MESNRKYVYVVEGMMDEDKLKKLGCTFVIKTGGKFIREDILSFLVCVSKVRKIVVVTDPDGAGRSIAKGIQNRIPDCLILKADKQKAIFHGKVGIAEMKLEDIESLLHDYLSHDQNIKENDLITKTDCLDLNLIGPLGNENRNYLIEKYHIPYTSGKNVLTSLQMLGKTKESIEQELSHDRIS